MTDAQNSQRDASFSSLLSNSGTSCQSVLHVYWFLWEKEMVMLLQAKRSNTINHHTNDSFALAVLLDSARFYTVRVVFSYS